MAKKVVLVTGAAIGIGRAVAFEMAKSGCRVIINYNTHKKEAEDLCAEIVRGGGEATTIHADLSNMSQLRAMFDRIDALGLTLDVLVNNAGISESMPFLEVTEEHFDRITAVDWRGVFLLRPAGGTAHDRGREKGRYRQYFLKPCRRLLAEFDRLRRREIRRLEIHEKRRDGVSAERNPRRRDRTRLYGGRAPLDR